MKLIQMKPTAFIAALILTSSVKAWVYAPYNEIKPLYDGVPNKIAYEYQPFLKVEQGCVPYPAVDNENNQNGRCGSGLKTTGSINGGCTQSPGQLYTRSAWVNGHYGIMYAWYFPKDQIALGSAGHKHDWEGMVVWLTNSVFEGSKLLAVCPSRHGTGRGNWHCDKDYFFLRGKSPKILYRPDRGNGETHALFTYSLNDGVFGQQPLIDWTYMGPRTRVPLAECDWSKASVPFLDSNFMDNMRNSHYDAFER